MPDALRRGQVKAAVFFPPFSAAAARDGASRTLLDSRAILGEVFDVLAVDPDYLRRKGDGAIPTAPSPWWPSESSSAPRNTARPSKGWCSSASISSVRCCRALVSWPAISKPYRPCSNGSSSPLKARRFRWCRLGLWRLRNEVLPLVGHTGGPGSGGPSAAVMWKRPPPPCRVWAEWICSVSTPRAGPCSWPDQGGVSFSATGDCPGAAPSSAAPGKPRGLCSSPPSVNR